MLSRIKGEVVFTCDGECGDQVDTGTDEFNDARRELKAERWITRLNEGTDDWVHYCPACAPSQQTTSFKRWMD